MRPIHPLPPPPPAPKKRPLSGLPELIDRAEEIAALSIHQVATAIRELIQHIHLLKIDAQRYETAKKMTVAEWADARQLERVTGKPLDEIIDNLAPFRAEATKSICNYPDCNCPLDAPTDPNWCARGFLRVSLERRIRAWRITGERNG